MGLIEFRLSWSGAAGPYQVRIGTASGHWDLVNVETTATSFDWKPTGPGTYFAEVTARNALPPPYSELRLTPVDLRDVIEALLFDSGRLSDRPSNTPSPTLTIAAWPVGQEVAILMAENVDANTRSEGQRFLNEYQEQVDFAVSSRIEVMAESTLPPSFNDVPLNSIVARITGSCAAAGGNTCSQGNPRFRRAFITLGSANGDLAHELGHSYGFGHVNMPVGANLSRPLMFGPNTEPCCAAHLEQNFRAFSPTELRALRRAWTAGLRGGSSRSNAVALGLVRP
jgi:hypothetical protein